ncbi:MAG: hypothetical protein ACEQR8_09060, partial [Cypionkella sp.]
MKHIAHPIIGDATHGKGPLNRAVEVRDRPARSICSLAAGELTMAMNLQTQDEPEVMMDINT